MALSKKEIADILGAKNLTCSNLDEYKNLDTLLHLTCKNGHNIDATLKSVRNAHFQCPYCQGNESIGDKLDGLTIPTKQGYRIVAVDNATENAGVSVFDDGKLVFYHLFHFSGDLIGRITKNKNLVRDVFIQQ